MTITRKPGIYFDEETTTQSTYDGTKIPLYIIQGSTEIAALDGKLTEFTDFDTFKTLTNNMGLTKTVDYIEDIILESGVPTFYVYKIGTDSATTFTNILVDNANIPEIVDVTYIEETKSAVSNTLTQKIAALKNGAKSNATNGVFRNVYIIPYGTIKDKIDNKGENVTSEQAVITGLNEITEAAGNGRISIIVPDSNAGFIAGHCIGSEYNDNIDYTPLENIETEGMFKFTAPQELALCNRGILLLTRESVQGVSQYRIYLGVTTSFKEDESDGYLCSRRICDELLRQFKFNAEGLIKDDLTITTEEDINTALTTVVDAFVEAEDINQEGTVLEVVDKGNQIFGVSGTITTTKPLIAIEVSTILS